MSKMYNQKPKKKKKIKEQEMFKQGFEIGILVYFFPPVSNILLGTSFNIASVIYFS